MFPTRPIAALALATATLVMPVLASAGCSTAGTGARCVRVWDSGPGLLSAASAPTALVAVGDVLERGKHSILLNAEYYGLPAVADGWVYMRVGLDLYRVDWQSQEVLERVTERAAANF